MDTKTVMLKFFEVVGRNADQIYEYLPEAGNDEEKGLIENDILNEVLAELEDWNNEHYAYLAFMASSFRNLCSVIDPQSDYLKKVFLVARTFDDDEDENRDNEEANFNLRLVKK